MYDITYPYTTNVNSLNKVIEQMQWVLGVKFWHDIFLAEKMIYYRIWFQHLYAM